MVCSADCNSHLQILKVLIMYNNIPTKTSLSLIYNWHFLFAYISDYSIINTET